MTATITHTEPAWSRPDFPSAEAWLADAKYWLSRGREPWSPVTRDELLAAVEHFPYATYCRWLPRRELLWLYDLPSDFGRPVEPLSERFQERLLATIASDQQFARAIRTLLGVSACPA